MELNETQVLRDGLETLKHAAYRYLGAALEADSDEIRQLCARLAVDKTEEARAVFNLMHQAGTYRTHAASTEGVSSLLQRCRTLLEGMEGPKEAVDRERVESPGSNVRF